MTPILDGDTKRREYLLVNESGLYTLILRSKSEEAKAFKKWITSEVLPSIRKTGSYGSTKKELSPIEQLESYLRFMKEQELKLKSMTIQIEDVKHIAEQSDDTLTSVQISEMDFEINKKCKQYGVKMIAGLIKKEIKKRFFDFTSSRTYKEIKRSDFNEAIELIRNFVPPKHVLENKK